VHGAITQVIPAIGKYFACSEAKGSL